MCVGKTLNLDSCSKFWGNLEGIWGNPGEILRKYRILDGRCSGSIGLNEIPMLKNLF